MKTILINVRNLVIIEMFSWGNSKNFTLSRLKKQKLNNPVQCISCNSVNTSYKTQTATPKRSKGRFY